MTSATGVKQVAVGKGHALARHLDGTVSATGGNFRGQLGLDAAQLTNRLNITTTFIKIPRLVNVTDIAVGPDSSFAVHDDGTVSAWGDDRWGQLGMGSAGAPDRCTDLLSMDSGSDPLDHTDFPCALSPTNMALGEHEVPQQEPTHTQNSCAMASEGSRLSVACAQPMGTNIMSVLCCTHSAIVPFARCAA